MKTFQIKFAALAVTSVLAFATPAFADDTPAGVASDVTAVQKDDTAIAKDNAKLAKNRADKAVDKANGNYGSQAVDSVNIGGDQTMKSEKQTEKSVDQKILRHDVGSGTGTDTDSSK